MKRLGRTKTATFLVAAALTACDLGVTGPEVTTPPQAAGGWFPGWSAATRGALAGVLESERARISVTQQLSGTTYDSLRLVWQSSSSAASGAEAGTVVCAPLPYSAETKIIGPDGGDLTIGPHRLHVPQGALSSYTVVTGEMEVSTAAAVTLSPHGLRFLREPTLMLSYAHCAVSRDHSHRIAYVGEHDELLEWPASYDSKLSARSVGWIWHFSRYIVAFRPPGYVTAGG
jgi:hypothetical protein